MMLRNVLPIALTVIDLLAGIVYLFCKDYTRAIYWFSAACLTTTTLFMKG